MEGAHHLKTNDSSKLNGRRVSLGRRGQVCNLETNSCNGTKIQPNCCRCHQELDREGVGKGDEASCKESPRRCGFRGEKPVLLKTSSGTQTVPYHKTLELPPDDGHKTTLVNDVPLGQPPPSLSDSHKRNEQNSKKPVTSPQNPEVRGQIGLAVHYQYENQNECSNCKHTCLGIAYKWFRNRIACRFRPKGSFL